MFKFVIKYSIIAYFITRSHGIVENIPPFWAAIFILISIFSIFLSLKVNLNQFLFLLKESKWIILSTFILISHVFFDHGNFRLFNTLNYLLFSLPFLFIGFFFGLKNYWETVDEIIKLFYFFLILYLFQKLLSVFLIGDFSGYAYNNSFVNDPESSDSLLFWPMAAFVSIYGFYLHFLSVKGIQNKLFTVFLFFLNILSFLASNKAAAIAFIIFFSISLFIIKNKVSLRGIIKVLIFLVIIFSFIYILGNEYLGNFGDLTAKSKAIIELANSGFIFNDFILDQITSSRYTAGQHSIRQFLIEPIWGHGGYGESVTGMLGDADKFTTASGNHSFVLDTLAYYGITGMPLIIILISFISIFKRLYKTLNVSFEEINKFQIITACFVAVFLSNLLNSFFLFSTFDQVLFFISGGGIGKLYKIRFSIK